MSAIPSSDRKYLIAGAAILAVAAGAYGLGRLYPPHGPSAGAVSPADTPSAYFTANRARPVPPGWKGTAFDAQEEFSMTPAEAEVLLATGMDTRTDGGETARSRQELAVGEADGDPAG
jgi:hypothetical protein